MTKTLSRGRIRQLKDIDFADRQDVGAKAAVLGGLRQAGFPVPDGVVLTATEPPFRLSEAEMGQLVSAAQRLAGPVAVRSSGIAEDGPEVSFAGQFITVLNVEGEAALTAAVQRCLDAAWTPGVQGAHHATQPQPMGILVQRMVSADAAGVAFSADPVTGDPGVRVNAVRGLGDRLVSGAVNADEWLVRDGVPASRGGTCSVIDAGQVTMVADLTRRVADHLGIQQDIEWAIADGHLFLLQARPITALPLPVPVDIPPGFWTREAIHAPDPLTPMMNSIWDYNAGLRRAAEEYGLLINPVGVEIGGWVYTSVEPVGAPVGAAAPPPWLLAALAKAVPALRHRVRQCRKAARTDAAGRTVERWYSLWRPEVVERIGRLEGVEVSELGDDELLRHLMETGTLIRDAAPIHYLVDFAHMLAVGELGLVMQDLLGWNDGQLFELCAGLSTSSTEPARQLAGLVKEVLDNPTLKASFETNRGLTVADLDSLDPQFASSFAAYQQQHGCRAMHDDLLQPTLGESPELTLRLVRDQIVRGYDPDEDRRQLTKRRNAAEKAARSAVPVADRAWFDRLLKRAQRGYAAREDNERFTTTIPLALVRLAALEVGRRLLVNHCVDAADDVFFHPLETACAALREGTDLRASSRLRRRERAWVESHPGPLSYGPDPGPPPSLRGFPKEVQHTARIFSWILNRALNTPASGSSSNGLTGVAASPGRYRGPVRVILDETQFDKLRPGDVLVAKNPSPVWSVLFPSIGALVTDVGGSLSHPSIIAREFRVPAVVSTGLATQALTDGQMVTVDGAAGTVEEDP
jgi:pyruvate,water dikinase